MCHSQIRKIKKSGYLRISFLIVLIAILTGEGLAQYSNYWSWKFNTSSTLVGGAVIGGNAGPSAIYYNPALIDHDNVPSLSLSASLVSIQSLKYENIIGEGLDGKKVIFKVHPRFISYFLPNKNERLGMEVGILSPISDEVNYTIQHFDEMDLIQRTQGPEIYSGFMEYSRSFDDTWVGFGASYEVSENFYLGGSSFLSIKRLKYSYRQLAQAYQEGDSVMTSQGLEARYISDNGSEELLKYWHLSFVFRFGVYYKTRNERLSIGLNMTLPNLGIYGEADVRKSYYRTNIYDNNAGQFTENEIAVLFEKKTRSTVKTPFSTAMGLQYYSRNKKNHVLITAEYFAGIDPYAIVDPSQGSVVAPGSLSGIFSNSDLRGYYADARPVTNLAVGYKQILSPTIFILGGFRTDFTAGSKANTRFAGQGIKINQVHLDKYHITVGPVILVKGKARVITGVQYTRGVNKDLNQFVNYANPVEYIPSTNQALEGIREKNARAIINEISLFFGMSVDFGTSE